MIAGHALEKLATGFGFTEGPAVDTHGNVFFSDQPNNRILKWSTDGKLSTFRDKAQRSNGLFIANGRLYACADEKGRIISYDLAKPSAAPKVHVETVDGKQLNGPNDLWVSPSGVIYFTDPHFAREYWGSGRKAGQLGERLYAIAPGASRASLVADGFTKPNGVVGTSDGKRLYVADIGADKTWKYSIKPDGSLSKGSLFCNKGSDGMTLDALGNVYLTGGVKSGGNGVTVFSPAGKQLGEIPVPGGWVGNVVFGGVDGKQLFITASENLYRLDMAVKGEHFKRSP